MKQFLKFKDGEEKEIEILSELQHFNIGEKELNGFETKYDTWEVVAKYGGSEYIWNIPRSIIQLLSKEYQKLGITRIVGTKLQVKKDKYFSAVIKSAPHPEEIQKYSDILRAKSINGTQGNQSDMIVMFKVWFKLTQEQATELIQKLINYGVLKFADNKIWVQ